MAIIDNTLLWTPLERSVPFLSLEFLSKKIRSTDVVDISNSISFEYNKKRSYSVADPGFSPGGGRQLPKVLLFFNFLPKTA